MEEMTWSLKIRTQWSRRALFEWVSYQLPEGLPIVDVVLSMDLKETLSRDN